MLTLDHDQLCRQLCSKVELVRRPDGKVMLDTPFRYPDGDHYPVYLSETGTGGVRVSDGAHTLMHLSYEHDVDKLFEGRRRTLMDEVVRHAGITFDDVTGEFYVEVGAEQLADAVFRLGQAITRIHDLTFLNRSHVASTFQDDLAETLLHLIPEDRIARDYVVPSLPDAEHYPVDFRISTVSGVPLFLYGIAGQEKARLTTIFLQHMLHHQIEFDSLLVFQNQQEIPRSDLARLTNVGGEMVASLNAESDLERKLSRKIGVAEIP